MTTTDWNLLAKHLRGESTPEDEQRLQTWLAEDPAHPALLDRARRAWEASGDVYQAYTPDTTRAWQAIDERTHNTSVVPIRRSVSRRTWLLRAAAVGALAVGLVYLVQLLNVPGGFGLAERSTTAYETQRLTLADGTQVWLNTNTTLRYPKTFDDSTRTVYLAGEAFFDVARDEQQPFRILSEVALVRVLGTSFNVLAPPEDTAVTVTVVSGTVALADQDETQTAVVLTKGEQGIYRTADHSVRKLTSRAPNALAWRTQRMVFDNQPLAEVGRVLEEVYRQPVVVDPTTADLRLTAQFDTQPLEEVLEVIALTLDVRYRTQDGTIYLEEIKK